MFPICWKCCNCIKADVPNSTAQTMVGCKENPKIKDFNDAQMHCPLNTDDVKALVQTVCGD